MLLFNLQPSMPAHAVMVLRIPGDVEEAPELAEIVLLMMGCIAVEEDEAGVEELTPVVVEVLMILGDANELDQMEAPVLVEVS